jgi:hypothetical protein
MSSARISEIPMDLLELQALAATEESKTLEFKRTTAAFPTIDRVAVGGGREVLVATVSPGQGRPYSYKGQAYRRVGNTSLQMSRDEDNRMLLEPPVNRILPVARGRAEALWAAYGEREE